LNGGVILKIEKVLNNNVAVIKDNKGHETVVMGRGIVFKKKPGDFIPPEQVEKVFTLTGKETSSKFQELLTSSPLEHVLVSEKIIRVAKARLGKKLSDNIYVTLTDHISMAIDRYREGHILKNAFLWDIRQFYPEEFRLGMEAIRIIRADCQIEFLEDEAAFMALHFVNAQLDEGMTMIHDMTKLIQEIANIVKYQLHIEYKAESLAYYRFINHLKYFAQRLFKHTGHIDDDTCLLGVIKEKHREAYRCTQAIAAFVAGQYNYKLSDEEMLYMTIHIARVVREARKESMNA